MPASHNFPASRYVSAVAELKRNQPVSVATAAKSGVAMAGVNATPSLSAASTTNRPVASAAVSLKDSAPRSSALLW